MNHSYEYKHSWNSLTFHLGPLQSLLSTKCRRLKLTEVFSPQIANSRKVLLGENLVLEMLQVLLLSNYFYNLT